MTHPFTPPFTLSYTTLSSTAYYIYLHVHLLKKVPTLHSENTEILSKDVYALPPKPKVAVDTYQSNVSSHFDSAIALRNDLVRDGFMDTNSATQWQEVLRHAAFYLKPRAELMKVWQQLRQHAAGSASHPQVRSGPGDEQ